MEYYRTADFPASRRMASWNNTYSSRFAQVTFQPSSSDVFDAELRVTSLGFLGFADVRTNGASIERTAAHINETKSHFFSFLLMAQGGAQFSHYGNETRLEAGDFTLCDNAAPHRIQLEKGARFLILRAAPKMLKTHLPCPEQLCGLRLPAELGLTGTASAMAHSLWMKAEEGIPEEFGDRIAGHLLDVLGTAYSISLGHKMTNSTVVGLRKAQAKQYIEAQLSDPDLSPGSVADAMRISPRYLRVLFAEENETTSAYILRRRLEECASQMTNSAWRSLTVSEIAFSWGFNSAAHFTRAFRAKYGMAPSEYRRMHLLPH
ncbi:helix-turn-helix domain-containing protein [Marinicaulis aureus]|uniref:Helix-turn-helix domain-containing protein n=1 Tax=Hyphococcus aureus TaxID=2666033 RepID=A0ABW1KUZ4_9PROT